jgi:Holliday junction DNA helicase RuvA
VIGYLSGVLRARQTQDLLIDVQGVGYEVQVSLNTWFELPENGQPVALYTHFVVRDDAQQLFGFGNLAERDLFRELIRVSGVGPRLALAVLSGMTVAEFVRCVRAGEVATLVRLPGVGRKTAERLLVELRDRLADWQGAAPGTMAPVGVADTAGEAESALLALGYKPAEAARMVAAAQDAAGASADSATLIRTALRAVVKN